MNRRPVVAGQFYPGRAEALSQAVAGHLAKAGPRSGRPTLLAMSPHAGYVYSGDAAGATLGQAELARTVVCLGPNHTGRGARMAVWPDGEWELPGGGLPVDAELASAICEQVPGFTPDTAAHLGEHSIEVILPFVRAVRPDARIVCAAVSERDGHALIAAGETLGELLSGLKDPVTLVVSSDMSHYVSAARAKRQDALALEPALALDPEGLLRAVSTHGISMCGVLPMSLGLAAAKKLGATSARLTIYTTSGDVSGDYDQVVGYAGVIVE